MALYFDSWATEMLAVLSTLFTIMYVTFKINYTYWKKKGLPYMKPSFPLGNGWNAILMRKCPGEDMKDVYFETEGKAVVGIYSLNNPLLVVRDPELIKMIVVRDFNYFPDWGIYVDEETDHLSAHLFFLGGTKWKPLRQKLTPTFTSGKMRAMFGIVRDCARILADVIPSGRDVEVRELIARYSTDVIASCAFGINVDSQHNPEAEFRQWGRRFFQTSLRSYLTLSLGFSNPKLRTLLPLPFTPTDITEYFTCVVDDIVKHREKTGIIRKDFMQLMIQLKNNGYVDDSFSITGKKGAEHGNKTLTTKEMAAQACVFFHGGFETSSTTVSFCLYELFRHPDIQKKLQEEVDDVMRKTNGDVTYDDIMTKMPYMEKVVNETLRMYPPGTVLNREVVQDYKLPEYDCVLEKGTKVIIPVMGLHYDRKYFRNPEEFDPEHFSVEQNASRHPYSYLPFGQGPRICIGMRFGLMQVKTAIVHLLSIFDILPVGDKQSKLRMAPNTVALTPVGGIHLRLERWQVPAC
ncbi:cytochrome P450 6k1-like [Schistocerca serialis cubense]|uniref:cytochrome P450 6k1-like n=1 Tax=Schistocerca serialis cubense TaxID=2023355 RepID=UPI00214F146E|nr:cytochrome P450 6k1-like [Schistocerca serialis cubense]